MYKSVYSSNEHPIIGELLKTGKMKRLAGIGMHCGCEYTKLSSYENTKEYSRLDHSRGVAEIVWNFTRDIKQTVAGLLHDISTPAFAHSVDFMMGDHEKQELTENKTREFIENSKDIIKILDKYGIKAQDVWDYHKYPVADNDIPMLSADRLEYNLGNAFNVFGLSRKDIIRIYSDIFFNKKELCFNTEETARDFARLSIKNSRLFISDGNRYSMQYLADVLSTATGGGVIKKGDIYISENEVIKKLQSSSITKRLWENFSEIKTVKSSSIKPQNHYCVRVSAKKRYVDPMVGKGKEAKRLSQLDAEIAREIKELLTFDFVKWIYTV